MSPTFVEPATSPEEMRAICLAEFEYWRDSELPDAVFALAAAGNIVAAFHGFRAPWHPPGRRRERAADWWCYHCRDGFCAHCVGPPCACACEWPKEPDRPEYEI